MAGDWMKVELELPDKPEVHAIATFLNLDPDSVVGKLLRIWQWFDKHTTDGNARNVTRVLLDRISRVTGFSEAMIKVGWMIESDNGLTMPKFERHTSQSAKTRALTYERVTKLRNAENVINPLQKRYQRREEKRREESKPKPSCTSLDVRMSNFDIFWKAYPKKKNKGDAEKAWKALKPDADLIKRLLEAVEVAKAGDDWRKERGQFIPYPASWIRAKGWEDQQSFPELSTPKQPDICLICGGKATRREGLQWFCSDHDKDSVLEVGGAKSQ